MRFALGFFFGTALFVLTVVFGTAYNMIHPELFDTLMTTALILSAVATLLLFGTAFRCKWRRERRSLS